MISNIVNNINTKELNVLSFPVHERSQSGQMSIGGNWYLLNGEGIKTWDYTYAPLPKNGYIIDKIPTWLKPRLNCVLSQNKFGQYPLALKISQELQIPLITYEHCFPFPNWSPIQIQQASQCIGHTNLFISEKSMKAWAIKGEVLRHGIDSELFKPTEEPRSNKILSVVNDWINRDIQCGYKVWTEVCKGLPTFPVGATPGLSEPAKDLNELVHFYSTHEIFVCTALSSPISTSLLEAAACECACVSFNFGIESELITHGETGFLCNTPQEMRHYLELLLKDRALCRKLGKNARQAVLEKFSMHKYRENFKSIIMRTIKDYRP